MSGMRRGDPFARGGRDDRLLSDFRTCCGACMLPSARTTLYHGCAVMSLALPRHVPLMYRTLAALSLCLHALCACTTSDPGDFAFFDASAADTEGGSGALSNVSLDLVSVPARLLSSLSDVAADASSVQPGPAEHLRLQQPSPDSSSGQPVERPWPFRPASLRLHPLSRFVEVAVPAADPNVPGSPRSAYEARIEFRDRFEHPTKSLGALTFTLASGRYSEKSDIPRDAILATWNADLGDLEVNRRHYDDITRTYVFQLELKPDLAPGQSCTLRVTLAATRELLSGQSSLEIPAPSPSSLPGSPAQAPAPAPAPVEGSQDDGG